MESKLVPEKGFPFFTVSSGAVKNQSLLKIAKTLARLLRGLIWAIRFLQREKPAAVIGVGGYVSVPICFAAFVLRIPIYLQEQNVSVGIANRVLGKLAKKVFLGFEEATASFRSSKCVISGNPIRKEFFNPDYPTYRAEANCLVVLGGSQGAKAVNDVVASHLAQLKERYPGLTIVHQTGKKDYESVENAYRASLGKGYEVSAFITDMASAYAKASLVIARSGALTVSELIAVGRPAILVPFPRRGQNDQTANAALLAKHGAAKVVEQGESFSERFWRTFEETFQPSQLAQMAKGYQELRKGGALATISGHISKDLGWSG